VRSADLLLVHGSWHGAWCWERVVPLLEQSGLRVKAVDLPSCGARPDLLLDLHGDVAFIKSTIDRMTEPVVVAAHSYGGAPVTAAAADKRVRWIVYLCAFMLDAGESCAGVIGGRLPEWCNLRSDGTFLIDPDAAPEVLYGDCDMVTQKWAVDHLVPQLAVTSSQRIRSAAWHTVPSTYVVSALDRAIPPTLQRHMAERAFEVIEIATSHSPFLSRPQDVARIIRRVADRSEG
jgi:pimeloyl-ACP methyl ester carboxylesterase